MTWVYGIAGLIAVIAGLRWLLARGDDVHADLDEIGASRRRDGGGVPDTGFVPDGVDVGRPGH